LQLKIGDIEIQLDENGNPCALIDVGRYGKKKESRIVGITKFTIQYYQANLQQSSKSHPDPTFRTEFQKYSKGIRSVCGKEKSCCCMELGTVISSK
jgi:uncharacterized short protein YbdD (DUF466 family)